MNGASRLTAAQLAAAVARERENRPDTTAMSNEERRLAGLMDRHQAAEHEHLRVLPHARPAERVHGPVPDDPWATENPDATLAIWKAWQTAGHESQGCQGWTQDSRDGRIICSCGEAVKPPAVTP